jgi:hypothetical protein
VRAETLAPLFHALLANVGLIAAILLVALVIARSWKSRR